MDHCLKKKRKIETSKQTTKKKHKKLNAQTRILIFEILQNSRFGSTQMNQLAKLSLTLLK